MNLLTPRQYPATRSGGEVSPCHSCHAGCCRSFAVPVTGADILRIERDLGLSFYEFACRWADPDGKVARRLAPQFYFEDEPQTPFVICLRHEASRVHAGTTMCRFLLEGPPTETQPLGQSRCGIYASRPAACRTYPMKLNGTGDLAVLHEVPPRGRKENHPAYSLCPRAWQPDDVDPLQGPQDLAVAKYEMNFFHATAVLWNRSPRPFVAFPDFIRLVYTNRVVPESKESPAVSVEGAATLGKAA